LAKSLEIQSRTERLPPQKKEEGYRERKTSISVKGKETEMLLSQRKKKEPWELEKGKSMRLGGGAGSFGGGRRKTPIGPQIQTEEKEVERREVSFVCEKGGILETSVFSPKSG